jgi:hypothetical protein
MSAQPAPFTTDAEVARLGRRLLDCSLPKPEWTHAAHLAATAWLVSTQDRGLERELPSIIRRYNVAVGGVNSDTEGYHETITQASLGAIRAFLAGLPADLPPHQACNRLVASPYGGKGWLLRYWSEPRLFSVEARRRWLEPDLAPPPFPVGPFEAALD